MGAFVGIAKIAARSRRLVGSAWLWWLAMLLLSAQAGAQVTNSIETMSVSKGSSGRTIVKFTLKEPLANPPAGFSTATPARVALDFPDTSNGLGHNSQEI